MFPPQWKPRFFPDFHDYFYILPARSGNWRLAEAVRSAERPQHDLPAAAPGRASGPQQGRRQPGE